MKSGIGIIAAVFLFVLWLSGCENSSSSSLGGSNKPIVCLGDSLTEGYGASKPGEVDKSKSYPAFLQGKIKAPVVNAGISGDTAADGLARLERDVLSKDPQMVIILLGGNDFLGQKSANESKADLKAILDKVRAEGRIIYLACFIGDSDWEESYLEYIPNNLIPEITVFINDYKRIFAELRSENPDIGYISNIWIGIDRQHMSDPIHPNAEGYKKIADNIFSVIKSNF